MDPNEREQTELLRLIWNEMKALGQNLGTRIDATNERLDQTNARLDQTNERLDQTNARLDQTNARLDQTNVRLDESNVRLGSMEEYLRDLAAQQLMLGRYGKHASERHGSAIDELRERVTRIETHLELKV